MSRLVPTAAEVSTLRFVLPVRDLRTRVLASGLLFLLGLLLWTLLPLPVAYLGLALVLGGHLPLWVRRQHNAPGGATPRHEDVWAPVEAEWMERVSGLEKRAERWDVSPWDVTNVAGCGVLGVVATATVGAVVTVAVLFGFDAALRLGGATLALALPLWLNGIRTTWNPSELRLKGKALEVARRVAAEEAADDFEEVPLLALREGRRGKYPVDARLMLRPREDDGSGLIGIQVQVALNNVQGRDYPYLYAVVLGKTGFELPAARQRHRRPDADLELVTERGKGDDVSYLVIRQHADRQGGWFTEPEHVEAIVRVAIVEARAARARNRPGAAP